MIKATETDIDVFLELVLETCPAAERVRMGEKSQGTSDLRAIIAAVLEQVKLPTVKLPLWKVRLKRDKQTVREFVVAADAETGMATAKKEHDQFSVTGVEQVRQIANVACDGVLVAQ